MPTYQYACTECGEHLEAVQSFADPALTECPACEGRLRKVFNSVGIVFKGSGFYRNDSRANGASGGPENGGSDSTKPDSPKTEPTKSESSSSDTGSSKSDSGKSDSGKSDSGKSSSGKSDSGSGSTPGVESVIGCG